MTTSAYVSASTCRRSRRHGHDARPAAGADGAADQAQPAHDRPHLPHRDRDHVLLRLAAVARRRAASCAAQGATRSRCWPSSPSTGSYTQDNGAPRADRSTASPPTATSPTSAVLDRDGSDRSPSAASPTRSARGAAADFARRGTARGAIAARRDDRGRRYVELIAPIAEVTLGSQPLTAGRPRARDGVDRPVGYVRLGHDVRAAAAAVPRAGARRAYRRGRCSSSSRSSRRCCSRAAWSRRCAG